VAQWYLCSNPDKMALVLMSEAHTPYITPLLRDEYSGYREIAHQRKNLGLDDEQVASRRLDTTLVVQAMLFGDGAVALLIGRGEGVASFGPISHLTNDAPEDVNLLTMEGGSLRPCVNGRPQYFMQPRVPARGAHYAVKTVRDVLAHPRSPVASLDDVQGCLIHTGSRKILDGVCTQLEMPHDSPKVRTSYETLRRYGNLSSASTGFMLAEEGARRGFGLVVGFGVGFTASAGVINYG
jgi:3-oxoacyl-[acyl-carrier-protein] synthase-3